MWSASALLGLRCPLLLYWSFVPHAGQCVMPMACARASTCFLNCLCSRVLVLLTAVLFFLLLFCLCWVVARRSVSETSAATLSNITLFFLFSSPLLAFLSLWNGGWRVVRAQLCEHARNTTVALCVLGCLSNGVCCFYHKKTLIASITT